MTIAFLLYSINMVKNPSSRVSRICGAFYIISAKIARHATQICQSNKARDTEIPLSPIPRSELQLLAATLGGGEKDASQLGLSFPSMSSQKEFMENFHGVFRGTKIECVISRRAEARSDMK
jgi:hypothetical protein